MTTKSAPLTINALCDLLHVEAPQSKEAGPFMDLATLELASSNKISFFFRPRMRPKATKSEAGLILVPANMDFEDPRAVKVENIWTAILALIGYFHPPKEIQDFVHPSAVIHESAILGTNVYVGPNVVIEKNVEIGDQAHIGAFAFIGEDVKIGSRSYFHPRVTAMDGTQIGERVILHSGVVLGSDGFKYEVLQGRLTKIPQVGIVIIENDAEIGANTTIDRASFSETRIGARTKIDNLVHIAHNCEVGSDCIIVGQTGVAGSTKLGRGVILAGQVGVGDNTTIGDGVKVGAKSGLKGNYLPGTDLLGTPAIAVQDYMKMMKVLRKMPNIYEKLVKLVEENES